MQRPRHQLFAGSAFANDEYGRWRIGHLINQREDFLQCRGRSDQSIATKLWRNLALMVFVGAQIQLVAGHRFAYHLQDVLVVGPFSTKSNAPSFTASTDSVMRP